MHFFKKGNQYGRLNKGNKRPDLAQYNKEHPLIGKNHPLYGKPRSDEVKRKVSETKKRLYKEGKIIPYNKGKRLHYKVWCDGLTKETDERVKAIGEKTSKALKGRTWENLYGKKKADELRNKFSKIFSMENNPSWAGGISLEPYGKLFNKQLKLKIRERDNFTCQECGWTEEQLNYTLDIHHIDFNKKNNSLTNLISLCRHCHRKTLFNRDEWIDYYTQKAGGIKCENGIVSITPLTV